MGTYDDRLAELRATAEGGSEGRAAYQQGRERLMSDQRAAIDAALAGPVRFEPGTADALDSIIRPVGDAGLARMDFAGERNAASSGELQGALDSYLSQSESARDAAYAQTLSDTQRARANASAGSGGGYGDSLLGKYTDAQLLKAVSGDGEDLYNQAVRQMTSGQRGDLKEQLRQVGQELLYNAISDPRERDAVMTQLLTAEGPEDVADLIDRYAPTQAATFSNWLGNASNWIGDIGSAIGYSVNQPEGDMAPFDEILARRTADQRAMDPILASAFGTARDIYDDGGLLDRQARDQRALELDQYLFDQAAYVNAGGNPWMARGLFPQDLGILGDIEDQQGLDIYGQTGMQPDAYFDAIEQQRIEDEQDAQTALASGAGLNPEVMDSALQNVSDPQIVAEALADPTIAPVVSQAVQIGIEATRNANSWDDRSAADLAVEFLLSEDGLDFENKTPAEKSYIAGLAAIVREQVSVYE